MVIKVGINGFGRIGRVIFRTCQQNDDIEISAINDPAIDVEYICYLIKFDSTHGKFNGIVTRCGDEIRVDDHQIKIFHEKLPSNVPWSEAGVQYVIEAAGMFTTLEKASGHLRSDTVKRVIVAAPSVDVPMIILGVNDSRFSLDYKVLSCGSSTLYCLAPIIKVLQDNFGVAEGFMTCIHAMTPSLKPLDGLCLRGKHWRDHRSIHQNIIPAATGACKALGKIIPDVTDKISGLAFRIPIVNVSVLDLTVRLTKNTTLEDIINCTTIASNINMKNIITISNEQSVSSDFIGDSHSCILDVDSSLQLSPNFFKLICWYENEHSYACRVVDSILFSERQFCFSRLSPLIGNISTQPCTNFNEVKQSVTQNKELTTVSKLNSGKEPELINGSPRNNEFTKENPRHVALKKPSSSYDSGKPSSYNTTQESKKRNDIFKIWNDTNETRKHNVRQKRASFFHSCVSFPQRTDGSNDCMKAQERLQNVKREFSKMVNITEDLLKKSYSNKVKLSTTVSNDIEEAHTKSVIEKENTFTGNCNVRNNKPPIFDICGDYKNKIEVLSEKVIPGHSKEEIITSNHFYENCASNCSNSQSDIILTFNYTPTQSKIELNSNVNSRILEDPCSIKNIGHEKDFKNHLPIREQNRNFKDEVAKTINALIDGLTQNLQIHTTLYEQSNTANNFLNADNNEIIVVNGTDDAANDKASFGNDFKVIDVLDPYNKDTSEDDLGDLKNEINESDYATDKYEDNNEFQDNTKYESNVRKSSKLCGNEQLPKINDHRKDMMLPNQILERLNRVVPEPVFIVSKDNMTDKIPKININNIYVKQNKLDIYDKLDSVSGSGSDDSFEIYGRKSQIIDITDLTNSIDDLANLEKICQIIEISDELSDKLFSTLKNKNCQEIHNNKWSFRDLCERIKLDEFCDNIFGKTV